MLSIIDPPDKVLVGLYNNLEYYIIYNKPIIIGGSTYLKSNIPHIKLKFIFMGICPYFLILKLEQF